MLKRFLGVLPRCVVSPFKENSQTNKPICKISPRSGYSYVRMRTKNKTKQCVGLSVKVFETITEILAHLDLRVGFK